MKKQKITGNKKSKQIRLYYENRIVILFFVSDVEFILFAKDDI